MAIGISRATEFTGTCPSIRLVGRRPGPVGLFARNTANDQAPAGA
jgi:hypothetical protein